MNCEKCQLLLDEYLDGELRGEESASLAEHLRTCAACAAARDDFRQIIRTAHDARAHLYEPPNSRAMWLRIRNTVETEEREAASAAARAEAARPAPGPLARFFDRTWQFTLPQLAAGVAALAVAVALVTTLGVRYAAVPDDYGVKAATPAQLRRAGVAEAHSHQSFLRTHQVSVEYWQQRVERRKANWNPRMRESFERSVYVLDQAVNDSLDDLDRNPHDGVAEEMLNSAMRDKLRLLREFGEQ
ncbi:MAG TPA: zf-HC2 domain-containing protein [Pyrinomonadaceae bacterium]|nr:zf-HC2 domain-containing protein [Pyrinomonadaceae bacterium]